MLFGCLPCSLCIPHCLGVHHASLVPPVAMPASSPQCTQCLRTSSVLCACLQHSLSTMPPWFLHVCLHWCLLCPLCLHPALSVLHAQVFYFMPPKLPMSLSTCMCLKTVLGSPSLSGMLCGFQMHPCVPLFFQVHPMLSCALP